MSSKPKNARSKRVLKNRESKVKENAKTAIFVRGSHTSEAVKIALSELVRLVSVRRHTISSIITIDFLPYLLDAIEEARRHQLQQAKSCPSV